MNWEDEAYWKKPIPIGVLPGGTSDGLGKTVVTESEEAYTLNNQIYCILRGKPRMMDVQEVTFESKPDEKIYSFLLVCWALISDADLESEVVWWMGSPRITIWTVWRLLALRNYWCKFSFEGSELTHREQTAADVGMKPWPTGNIGSRVISEEEIKLGGFERSYEKDEEEKGNMKLNHSA